MWALPPLPTNGNESNAAITYQAKSQISFNDFSVTTQEAY